jgi:hypothetical protein
MKGVRLEYSPAVQTSNLISDRDINFSFRLIVHTWSGAHLPSYTTGSRDFFGGRVRTGSGDHPSSYRMGARGFFPGGKVAGT